MNPTLLALDLGTTQCKTCLVDAQTGQILRSASAAYPTRFFADGGAEQSPQDWWNAVRATCQTLSQAAPQAWKGIAAVGCTGQMNGVVPVDSQGKAVRAAIIHADTRSVNECAMLEKAVGAETFFQQTANRLDPRLSLPKVAYWLAREPGAGAQTAFVAQAKDYLTGRLTGRIGVTDPSDASLMGGFDVARRRWVDGLWEAAQVPLRLLPTVLPSADVVGTVSKQAARALNLASGTPVAVGAGDGACSTAGSGVGVGEGYCALGGTSWIGIRALAPVSDSRLSHYCAVDETLTVFGAVQSAGSSLTWLTGVLNGMDSALTPSQWEALAAPVPAGSRGLTFLPYLQGERAPIWDANARGAFVGLTMEHGRGELYRAVLEGIGYALASVLTALDENGFAGDNLRVLGGGAGSLLWRRVLASVFRRRLDVLNEASSATSLGAAMVAAKSVGILPDWDSARRWASVSEEIAPVNALAKAYAPRFALFQRLYPLLQETFAEIATLESGS